MAFITIPSSWITVGKAVKKELFDYVKDNFDDHETRIGSIEAAVNRISPFNYTVLNATRASSITGGLGLYRATNAFTFSLAKLAVFDVSGLTGTLEIDVQKSSSPDFTSSVSIFTTRPSINVATSGNYAESTNAVIGASGAISDGDWLRLDITSLPTGLGRFNIAVEGEV